LNFLESLTADFANMMWGPLLLVLLVFGGLFFTFKHGIDILLGKYDEKDDPGDINHFQALSSALASTVGMGNISGVAIAIHMGGPGALFWMWVSAIVGMSTKFFTCTLAVLYRGKDDRGNVQGGPMYVIETALSSKFKPLAIIFSAAGLIGCLPIFQANQLTQTIREEFFKPSGLFAGNVALGNAVVGVLIACVVAGVIFGGIKRIGLVASRLVPFMVVLYLFAGVLVLLKNITEIPGIFSLIFYDAFTGQAVVGGAVGEVIRTGVRRAAFSNEAGLGTEAMAHGAAKTKEPVREGLVAMTGPFIDTIVICSVTALVILLSGVWENDGLNGVSMTIMAFTHELGGLGKGILLLCILIFSITTMFSQSYYGTKCTGYLFGTKWKNTYKYFYISAAVMGATVSLGMVINLIDGVYAVMAFPTMISTLILAPRVMAEARRYFSTL